MEIKKTGKGLKVLVGLLALLLIAVIGYIIVDKFVLNKKVDSKESENKVAQLTEDDAKKMFDRLIVSNSYGLYFEKKTTIDNISAYNLIPYVVLSYIKDNNITASEDSSLTYGGTNYEKPTVNNGVKISKKDIDNYIKNMFNTTKVFTMPESEKANGWSVIEYIHPKILFTYNIKDNNYYIAARHDGLGWVEANHKYLKFEQDDNNVYIYSNPLFCFGATGGYVCTSSVDGSETNRVISYSSFDEKTPVYVTENGIDAQYVFNNMSDKLETYKTTFKKAEDGKYYWYSSEIVEQAKTTTTDTNKNSNTNNNQSGNTNTNSESVITTNKFDLSKISCTNQTTSTCTKTVKVGLNGANHVIKIESIDQSVAGQTNTDGRKWSDAAVKLVHKIYLDDKYLKTIDDGNVYDAKAFGNQPDNTKLNIYGYVFIFDKEYFATILPYYSGEKLERKANFFTSAGEHIGKLQMDLGWSGFGINGKDLDDISNLEFDGHTLKVWDVDCGYDFDKDGDAMKIVQKHITIENGALKIKNGKIVNNGFGGGQAPTCKIKS